MPFTCRRPIAALALLAMTACVPAPQAAPPAPAPVPAKAPPPPPVAQSYARWIDAPQTAGDWRWQKLQGASTAIFSDPAAQPLMAFRCDSAARAVEVVRYGQVASGQVQIRTETQDRLLPAPAAGNGGTLAIARLPASDRLLDAMAFSRGRFAVEAAGLPTLYLPSWPEISRVVEDCR